MIGLEHRCDRCRYWSDFGQEGDEDIGTCRRFPPVPVPWAVEDSGAYGPTQWEQPTTRESSWCGEFSAFEVAA